MGGSGCATEPWSLFTSRHRARLAPVACLRPSNSPCTSVACSVPRPRTPQSAGCTPASTTTCSPLWSGPARGPAGSCGPGRRCGRAASPGWLSPGKPPGLGDRRRHDHHRGVEEGGASATFKTSSAKILIRLDGAGATHGASCQPAAVHTCSAPATSATWSSSTRARCQTSQAMLLAPSTTAVPGRQAGNRAPISRSDASQILRASSMSRSGGHSICSEGAPPTSARLGP